MRRARIAISCAGVFAVTLLVFAPAALARAYGGEGWYGETSDKTITYAMYIVIVFFPPLITSSRCSSGGSTSASTPGWPPPGAAPSAPTGAAAGSGQSRAR